jgi:hypothetical protein
MIDKATPIVIAVCYILLSISRCYAKNLCCDSYICHSLKTDDIDKVITYLLNTVSSTKLAQSADSIYWQKCQECEYILARLEHMKLHCYYTAHQKRIIEQIIDNYVYLKKVAATNFATNTNYSDKIPVVLNTCLLLNNLKEEVRAAFEDNVPDNKELGVQLKQNIDEHTVIVCGEIKQQSSILESIIAGKINATHEALNCESESQTAVIEGKIAESEKRITDKIDKLLKDRNKADTLSSCMVIGLAYYASGVVGGLATCCFYRCSDDFSLTVTGEVLGYHEPVTSNSHIGVKLGIGSLIAKKYNISIGGILFDSTLNPNGEGSIAHRISISLDYWRSNGLSLGVGYSPLTGLGGRVLLGL